MLDDEARILANADAVIAAWDEREADGWTAPYALRVARAGARAASIAWAAAALGESGSPRTAHYVTETLGRTEGYDDRWHTDERTFVQAIIGIVELGGEPAVAAAAKLVKARSPLARLAIAKGLGKHAASSSAARDALFALHADPDDEVRGAAREALGGQAPPPWWGVFSTDPLADRSPAGAAALRAPLERALSLCARRAHELRRPNVRAQLRAALAALPDELAMPIATRLHTRVGLVDTRTAARWIMHDGGRAFVEVVTADERPVYAFDGGAKRALARCDAETRSAIYAAIIARLPLDEAPPHYVAIDILDTVGSPDDDVRPLWERLLGTRAEDAGTVTLSLDRSGGALATALVHALRRAASARTLAEPLVAAHRAGFPGAWTFVSDMWRELLARSREPAVDEHVARILAAPDGKDVGLAMLHVVQRRSTHAERAEARALLRDAVRSPSLRGAILDEDELVARLLTRLRRELPSGRLPADEAAKIFVAVARAHEDDAKAAPTQAEIDGALESVGGAEDLEPAARVLPTLVGIGAITAAHPLVRRVRDAWRAGGEGARRQARALLDAGRQARERDRDDGTWRTLVEEIFTEAKDPALRAVAKLELDEWESER